MKFLRPQRTLPRYYEPIERQLEAVFYDLLYKDIIAAIKAVTGQETKLNAAVEALVEAVRSGKVQYRQDDKGEGVFSGQFNARIGKQIRDLGGRFDSRSGIYRISQALVPAEIKSLAALAEQRARELHENLMRAIDKTQAGLDDKVGMIDLDVEPTIGAISHDFSGGIKDIEVKPPELTEEAAIRLESDYTKNMRLYIKKWAEEHIVDLREVVERSSREGYRFDNLIGLIRDAHGTTQAKATFLARQETALFTAKYRKERLGDIGVRQYKWSARSSKLTRPDHWALHGKIFSYDSPPIVDRASGRRGNPGEDFGCLCADIPVLGRVEVAA